MNQSIRPAAREDILRQYRYYLVKQDAPATALRFLEAVEETISRVCHRPEMGPSKVLDNPRLTGLRSWPVKGFAAIRIYYLSSAAEVRIIRVLHGKRDIAPVLEQESTEEES